ncbi:unnamed protein product [Lymnaea stagnalis]|uniref:ABC transporter domain-containing protein n=1 Tax=Lymnaea stagnalis TaxID=6523 RepID=A0AAV2IEC8_LYMST
MIFLCMGGKLDPAKAFVATTLFSILHNSLNNFAHFIPSIVQAKISLRRLNDFLHKNDIAKDVVLQDKWADSEVSVHIDKGEFKWTPSGEHATLQGIDMEIAKGSFVAVVGSVGTGKSSLLSAIMGQMHKSHGTVNVQVSI